MSIYWTKSRLGKYMRKLFSSSPDKSLNIKFLGHLLRDVLLIVTELAIIGSLFSFMLQRQDVRVAQTIAAWQLIIARAPGNSGKIEALEYLNS